MIKAILKTHKGASVVEYVVLMMLITGALYMMKDTISRGIFARYKSAGDSYAFGRQYDANRSTVCKTDLTNNGFEITYDDDCYNRNVMKQCSQCYPGDEECFDCEDGVKASCQSSECQTPGCLVQSCASLGANCGMPSNGCGGRLHCGTCASNQVCSPNNVCIADTLNARCGTTPNTCEFGSFSDLPDTRNNHKWQCQAVTRVSCTMSKMLNGVCGTAAQNTCQVGNVSDISETATQYLWKCTGFNGGLTFSCSFAKPPAP